jgi:8-amino-7-oxononanoate synthase
MPYGHGGAGLLRKSGVTEGLEDVIYVAGLSKSFSSLAAFVSCRDAEEKQRLSAAATWVFSGPCPTASLATAIAGIDISLSEEGEELRAKLLDLTRLLVTTARDLGFVVENQNLFPLVSIVIGSVKDVVEACKILWRHGILITPAVYPTVPLHRSMLRFTLTAANTEEQVFQAIEALAEIRDLIPGAPYA